MIYMKISIYIFNRYLNNEKWTGGFRFRKNREWKGKNETNKKVFIISGFIIWSLLMLILSLNIFAIRIFIGEK